MTREDHSDDAQIPFIFVRHGEPEPTAWMAAHPDWVKIPATFIPHQPAAAEHNRATAGLEDTQDVAARRDAPPPPPAHHNPAKPTVPLSAASSNAQAAQAYTAGKAALEAARERAFLHLLRWSENGDVPDNAAYRARFGGHDPMTDADMAHYKPKKGILRDSNGTKIESTAAGAYQILGGTWAKASRSMGVSDIEPATQDAIAMSAILKNGARDDVRAGNLAATFMKLHRFWSSLPGGSQSHHSAAAAEAKFHQLVENELQSSR